MFIVDAPAMKIGHLLVIADLHLGITRDIWEKGIRMPSQVSPLAARLNALKKTTKTTKLVILGDVKHRIPVASWQEKKELPEFFSLLKFRKTIITKGNHDGKIEGLVPGNVSVRKSYVYGDYVFTHGHRKIKTAKKVIVMGHNQPHVKFRDKFGATYIEPVWVRGPLRGFYRNKRAIMVPAFNRLAGATVVNRDKLLGPIASCLDMRKTHCYLLDGTDLGVISDIMVTD